MPDACEGGAPTRRSTAAGGDVELLALEQLDADALRRRWRALVSGPLPKGLGRGLILRILAYRQQAQRLGDLDLASQRALMASLAAKGDDPLGAASAEADPKVPQGTSTRNEVSRVTAGATSLPARMPVTTLAQPGTVLVREHAGSNYRVMVLDDGFAWNGRTYDSLTQVAFAITGTRWNGPRFFGLRPGAKPGAGARR